MLQRLFLLRIDGPILNRWRVALLQRAWSIEPTISGSKREVQCLLKIGILAKHRRKTFRPSGVGATKSLAPGIFIPSILRWGRRRRSRRASL
jgi:hypothetical protein